jgi:hypothetical protein
MPGLLTDVNAEGHVEAIVRICESDDWNAYWTALDVRVYSFAAMALLEEATDLDVWEFCQSHDLLLVTANRNEQGEDSLEAAIKKLNRPSSLPVLTLARPKRLLLERAYCELAAIRLMEILLDIDLVRGTGRLWLPAAQRG